MMDWSIINILMFFGALQGFVLSIIVFFKKGNSKAGKCLSLVLFAFSMNLLYYFASDVGLFAIVPFLRSCYLPWSMLASICFYLYVTFSAPFQKRLTLFNKLGFVPFIVFSLIYIAIRLCTNFSGNHCYLSNNDISFIYLFEEYFGILYAIVLGIMSFRKINTIEIQLQEQITNYNESKLKFHKNLLILALIYSVLWFILYTVSILNNIHSLKIYYLLWLFLAVIIHWVAWTGFIKDDALLPNFPKSKLNTLTSEKILENEFSKIKSFKESNAHYIDLINLFEKNKIFLDPHLSLSSLAEKLSISNSYLSALINQLTRKNFYHFVNAYRIKYLISLFEKGEINRYTILSLAFQSGFNSKSTFQATFKKIIGKTPTQYIKLLNK